MRWVTCGTLPALKQELSFKASLFNPRFVALRIAPRAALLAALFIMANPGECLASNPFCDWGSKNMALESFSAPEIKRIKAALHDLRDLTNTTIGTLSGAILPLLQNADPIITKQILERSNLRSRFEPSDLSESSVKIAIRLVELAGEASSRARTPGMKPHELERHRVEMTLDFERYFSLFL